MKRQLALTIALALIALVGATCAMLAWRGARLQSSLARVLCDTTSLRTGDLVFRNGLGNESLLVTTSSGGEYSHVGIAIATPNGWHVIHAVPGEAPAHEPDYLKCEPIAQFFDPHRAMAGAMARVDCDSTTATAAALHALHKATSKIEFDHSYNMDDSTRLYCTELVVLAYGKQSIDLCQGRYAPTPGIGTSGRIIYPEHLWVSTHIATRQIFPAQ